MKLSVHSKSALLLLAAATFAHPRPTWAGPISLPLPIYFEDFNAVAEGSLPAGWYQTNYSDLPEATFDLHDLDSSAYATWLVVDRSRFTSNFVGYLNHTPVDYSRVLSFNPNNVVNGQIVTNLGTGRFLFATSGYREGNQVMYLYTPDFDLTGRTNVYVSYHSLYEQNQDSIGALEYSVDSGAHWLPVVYMLDGPDVIPAASGGVDASTTFTNRYPDVAVYTDPVTHTQRGGYYGAFIAAPISQALATNISARVNDDAVESKRVELFRLPAADNQPAVRFRLAQAGTDSWYWGIDDFGIYSIFPGQLPVIVAAPASLNLTPGLTATFSVSATGPGPVLYQWQFNGVAIPNATNSTFTLGGVGPTNQGTYAVLVSNASGSILSPGAFLSIYPLAVTSQWDFDGGDLRATVGTDLEFVGDTATITRFPSHSINGRSAQVMAFGTNSPSQGLVMHHGAQPNGGGRFVNQYTLLLDVMFPAQSSGHLRALFQTDPFNHLNNDAEFYVGGQDASPDPNGLGTEGQFNGPLAPDTWYRLVFAVDLTASAGQQLTKYVNGVKVGSQSLSGGVDGRYALGPTALLFTSGLTSGGLTQPGFVNSIQFVNGWMPPDAVAALGGPTAEGLPAGDAALKISSTELSNSALALAWTGPTGQFQTQLTSTLVRPNWQPAAPPTTNHSLTLPIQDPAAFYRIGQLIPDIQVGQLPGGREAVPTKQILRAAGSSVQSAGRPVDLCLSPDGKTLYIKNINNLVVVDTATWTSLQTVNYPASGASMHGIAVSKDGNHIFLTGAANELYDFAVAPDRTVGFSRTIPLPAGADPCGVALTADGSRAYVCLSILNALAVVSIPSGSVLQQIPVGIAPWDVVLTPDESQAYVSDWGGRSPTNSEPSAASAGTPVLIDARGVAASGAVSVVNLVSGAELAKIPTGLHPSDLELSPDGTTLYVANANSDTVTVIDTQTRTLRETILVRPDASFPYGSASDGLALSRDGRNLFVASAGNNAIAVVELPNAQHTNSLIQGFIPTDWYPGAVVADSNFVYAVNVKGLGTRLGEPTTTSWTIGTALGTANKIPFPDAETLSKLTAEVFENGRVTQIRQTQQPPRGGQPPVPVPPHVGEPSVFQHVLYILKENKTYDQMFGDFSQANGDPNLCIYPQFVSPNHHALAQQFVLLDNFYCAASTPPTVTPGPPKPTTRITWRNRLAGSAAATPSATIP
jgi:YVTN family beta-propeller protein